MTTDEMVRRATIQLQQQFGHALHPHHAKVARSVVESVLSQSETIDTGWHPLKTFGDGDGVYLEPGQYLVLRLDDPQ
jgi:hypothetical protein